MAFAQTHASEAAEKRFLNLLQQQGLVEFFSVEDRYHAQNLFEILDSNKNGLITEEDFSSHKNGRHIWDQIRERFDFDGNRSVDADELTISFLMEAVYSEDTNTPVVGGSIADQLAALKRSFSDKFRQSISRFEAKLNLLEVQPPVQLTEVQPLEIPELVRDAYEVGDEISYLWQNPENGEIYAWVSACCNYLIILKMLIFQ
jgi:hypothetical protein